MTEFGGYVDPNYPDPNGPGDATIIIYGYIPSTALSALGIAVTTCLTIAHTARTARSRTWFTVPLIVASAMELGGYICRLCSNKIDPYLVSFFVAQYFLITTAPILITASLYFCLTKILAIMKEENVASPLGKILTARLVLWIFITADVITTIVQVTGAGLIGSRSSNHQSPATANWIVLAGITIQTFFFIIFIALFGITLRAVLASRYLQKSFRLTAIMVGVASVPVLVRLVFRIAETAQGVFGYLSVHEAFLGALDFFPIMLALTVLAVWHPGTPLKLRKPSLVEKS